MSLTVIPVESLSSFLLTYYSNYCQMYDIFHILNITQYVTLKYQFDVSETHWTYRSLIDHVCLPVITPIYLQFCILPLATCLPLNNNVTVKYLLQVTDVIQIATNRQLVGGLLFIIYCNYYHDCLCLTHT